MTGRAFKPERFIHTACSCCAVPLRVHPYMLPSWSGQTTFVPKRQAFLMVIVLIVFGCLSSSNKKSADGSKMGARFLVA